MIVVPVDSKLAITTPKDLSKTEVKKIAVADPAAVPAGVDLTGASKVLVTLLGHPGGTTALQRVALNTTADTFTVHLTANAAADTKFAWFVIS